MTAINTGTSIVTLVNVFETTPENQQELIDLATKQSEEVVKLPGCISSNLHASRDGLRLVNYAQWENEESFMAMLNDHPELKPRRDQMEAISKPDVHIYDVLAVYEGSAARTRDAA
jgi:quinol monooxygenase YgiN